jgi:hypothetical protein
MEDDSGGGDHVMMDGDVYWDAEEGDVVSMDEDRYVTSMQT